MNNNKDISIIEWQPLPAPADRYLLVRFEDPDEPGVLDCELAYSIDGINFLGDNDIPFYAPVEKWAFLPYDN